MNKDMDEVRRILDVLRTLSRMMGISNREVERRLHLHPSFLTRLYSGQVEAKLEVVLGIARAIGLEYPELFDLLYPERPNPDRWSAAAQRIHGMLEGLHPPRVQAGAVPGPQPREAAASSDTEAIRDVVRQVLTEVLEKRPEIPPKRPAAAVPEKRAVKKAS
jgi:transcriptional regulator with XRE-family HTH domain